jgi:hypothetical protein
LSKLSRYKAWLVVWNHKSLNEKTEQMEFIIEASAKCSNSDLFSYLVTYAVMVWIKKDNYYTVATHT